MKQNQEPQMTQEAHAAEQEKDIPDSGSRKARTAKLEVRFAEVTLQPPQNKKLPPLTLFAVYAQEVDYGQDVKAPVEWMLLTTVAVTNFEQALERLSWYAKRWGIEVYHRTIKSGCRIEDRRLGDAEGLESCLAIDLVVGWRVFFLTMHGRERPETPCDVILSEDEWKAL